MGILLGLMPFILFVLLTPVSVSLALWIAMSAAFVISIRDFGKSRAVRQLDIGGLALFFLLAIYAGFIQPSLSLQAVRLIVDAGMLILAGVSLVRRMPFTLEYARDLAPQEVANTPQFVRANYVIAMVWTGALALMTLADCIAVIGREIPISLDIAVGFAAVGAAIVFTVRNPLQAQES